VWNWLVALLGALLLTEVDKERRHPAGAAGAAGAPPWPTAGTPGPVGPPGAPGAPGEPGPVAPSQTLTQVVVPTAAPPVAATVPVPLTPVIEPDPLSQWAGAAPAGLPVPAGVVAVPVPPAAAPPAATPRAGSYVMTRGEAATALRTYYEGGGRDRTVIAAYQRSLGIPDDGIVGPNTVNAAATNGVTITPTPADRLRYWPATAPATSTAAQATEAARALAAYYGSGGRAANMIAGYQRTMGGLTADGVVGTLTIQRAAALGVTISAAPAASQTPTSSSVASNAARELAAYYNGGGRSASTIAGYQRTMGGLNADGIVGDLTIARASQLGATIHFAATPANVSDVRTPASASETESQRSAAAALARYYNGGGRDHVTIRSWQQAMGGGIAADGIVGPATRARASVLGSTIH